MFVRPAPPHSCRVLCSTQCPCWLGAEWCRGSDGVTNLGLQGAVPDARARRRGPGCRRRAVQPAACIAGGEQGRRRGPGDAGRRAGHIAGQPVRARRREGFFFFFFYLFFSFCALIFDPMSAVPLATRARSNPYARATRPLPPRRGLPGVGWPARTHRRGRMCRRDMQNCRPQSAACRCSVAATIPPPCQPRNTPKQIEMYRRRKGGK